MTTITIPKQLTKGEELIVIPLKEYEGLQKYVAEVQDALAKITKGEEELITGKTKVISSLREIRERA